MIYLYFIILILAFSLSLAYLLYGLFSRMVNAILSKSKVTTDSILRPVSVCLVSLIYLTINLKTDYNLELLPHNDPSFGGMLILLLELAHLSAFWVTAASMVKMALSLYKWLSALMHQNLPNDVMK